MMLNEPPSAAAAGQRLINVQEPLRELNSFQSSLVTTAGGSSKAHGCATFGYQASAIKTSLWEPEGNGYRLVVEESLDTRLKATNAHRREARHQKSLGSNHRLSIASEQPPAGGLAEA
mmetsp:Transcript_18606/g.34633  ORF Transcript_18606/g.34633 Transcript_18606/m.34633 type:complete len:118 (+) Transcript_18606:2029-2382(+)